MTIKPSSAGAAGSQGDTRGGCAWEVPPESPLPGAVGLPPIATPTNPSWERELDVPGAGPGHLRQPGGLAAVVSLHDPLEQAQVG